MRIFLFFIFLFNFSQSAFAQAPWSPRIGGGHIFLNFNYRTFDSYLQKQDSEEVRLNRAITNINFTLGGEFGATDKITLVAKVPVSIVNSGNTILAGGSFSDTLESGQLLYLGNAVVGFRYKFYHRKWVLAAGLKGELKTSQYSDITGLRTGLGSWGIVPAFYFGRIWKERFYFRGTVAACLQFNDYSSNFRFNIEGGAQFFNALWIRVRANNRTPFRNGNYIKPNNLQTGLYLNNQQWIKLGIEFAYQHPKAGIGFNASINGVFAEAAYAATPLFRVGLFYKWKYDYSQPEKD